MMERLPALPTLEDPALLAVVAMLAVGILLVGIAALAWQARKRAEAHAVAVSTLTQAHSDTAARLEAMIEILFKGQTQLAHSVNERLDSVSTRLGDSLEKTKQSTTENLQKLNERLALIDRAQKNISDLASQVTSLQNVLANKQSRGSFGQARMEIIIRDGLPKNAYEFQYTLSNRMRPDCAVFLPNQRPLVIDAKFPLEAITAYKEAESEDERRQAGARVRQDMTKHIGDIADKYLIPGETQDIALMFVPSESVYADLQEEFDDIVQKAFRAKVVIVSPSLLMVCVHVIQQMQKEERMREAAGQIQVEVGRLIEDVERLRERVLKLQGHFSQANEDVRQIVISAEKIEKRGARIQDVEFEGDMGSAQGGAEVMAAPITRKLQAGE
jgi:DNA recombination protein RmuC